MNFGLVTTKVVTPLDCHDEVLQTYVTVMLITVILCKVSLFVTVFSKSSLNGSCRALLYFIHLILKSSYVFFMVPKTLEPLGVCRFLSL